MRVRSTAPVELPGSVRDIFRELEDEVWRRMAERVHASDTPLRELFRIAMGHAVDRVTADCVIDGTEPTEQALREAFEGCWAEAVERVPGVLP